MLSTLQFSVGTGIVLPILDKGSQGQKKIMVVWSFLLQKLQKHFRSSLICELQVKDMDTFNLEKEKTQELT